MAHHDEIVEAIAGNRCLVLIGDTGSGKTTQLPRMCLDAGRGQAGMIGCTQPRRIAAFLVADRVAEESNHYYSGGARLYSCHGRVAREI